MASNVQKVVFVAWREGGREGRKEGGRRFEMFG